MGNDHKQSSKQLAGNADKFTSTYLIATLANLSLALISLRGGAIPFVLWGAIFTVPAILFILAIFRWFIKLRRQGSASTITFIWTTIAINAAILLCTLYCAIKVSTYTFDRSR